MTLKRAESSTRCVLYPDTSVCGLGSASSCRLVIREAAPHVYLRTGESVRALEVKVMLSSPVLFLTLSLEALPLVTAISIPGQGTLQGAAAEAALGSVRKTVLQFLGVPYARPPIGSLRFEAAQPVDWTGTWNATEPR